MQLLRKRGILDSPRVLFLPVDEIVSNPDQPRKAFPPEELEELARSIQTVGLLQPLSVRRRDGRWELVAGERRLRAARLAGLREVPCLSLHIDSQQSSVLALVENVQRRNLDFWEEAQALDRLVSDYRLSQEEVSRRVGKSQSAVANKLRLLRLPPDVLELLRDSGCGERHARALLSLPSPELQRQAARAAAEQGLTVVQLELLVGEMLSPPPPPPETKRPRRPFVVRDVRLFLNTLDRSLSLMQSAGVDAQCSREDLEGEILLTIRIPNHSPT